VGLGEEDGRRVPGPDNGEPGGVLDSLALAYPGQSQRALLPGADSVADRGPDQLARVARRSAGPGHVLVRTNEDERGAEVLRPAGAVQVEYGQRDIGISRGRDQATGIGRALRAGLSGYARAGLWEWGRPVPWGWPGRAKWGRPGLLKSE